MTKNTSSNTTKTTTGEKVIIGAGITGILVAATLGAKLLFNTKKGKQSLKHIKSWAFKMKGEVLEKLERAKEINEEAYNKIVDDLGDKYAKIKGMTLDEVTEAVKELKSQWKSVQSEVKKTLKAPHAKPKTAKTKSASAKTK